VSFSKIVGGLGHAISYYPKVAKQLGDPCSAIALQQFLYWSFDDDKAAEDGWIDVIGKDCLNQLGMSAKTMTRVKKSLESMGLIETRVSGMPARCQVRVLTEAIDFWWSGVVGTLTGFDQRAKQVSTNGSTELCPKGETIPLIKELKNIRTFDEIMAGAYDGMPPKLLALMPSDALCPILRAWATAWGKPPDKAKMTAVKKKSWVAAMKDGVLPSDFCKAVLGMRFDDWEDRRNFCDWKHTVKDVEKWVELYELNAHKKPPPIVNATTKLIEKTFVPKDYEWTKEDSFMAARGTYNFNVDKRRWESKNAHRDSYLSYDPAALIAREDTK
jgi:hypothetical protein